MKTILLAGLLLVSGSVSAENVQYVTMGDGAVTCAKFGEDYRVSPVVIENEYFNWAQGFLSGMNSEAVEKGSPLLNLSSIPVIEQMRKIREYCDRHPLGYYF